MSYSLSLCGCLWLLVTAWRGVAKTRHVLVVGGITAALCSAGHFSGTFTLTYAALLAELLVADIAEVFVPHLVYDIRAEWARFACYMGIGVLTAVTSFYALIGLIYPTLRCMTRRGPWRLCRVFAAAIIAFAPAAYTIHGMDSMSESLFWHVYDIDEGIRMLRAHMAVFAAQVVVAVLLLRALCLHDKVQALAFEAVFVLFNAWAAMVWIYPMVDFL